MMRRVHKKMYYQKKMHRSRHRSSRLSRPHKRSSRGKASRAKSARRYRGSTHDHPVAVTVSTESGDTYRALATCLEVSGSTAIAKMENVEVVYRADLGPSMSDIEWHEAQMNEKRGSPSGEKRRRGHTICSIS